jgi:hypothetical protein
VRKGRSARLRVLRKERDDERPSVPLRARLPEDERLAREAAAVRNHWDRELRAVEQAHHDSMQSIRDKLARASRLIDESGVGEAAVTILKVMHHWPSWSKRADWRLPLAVEGLDGGDVPAKDDGLRDVWLAFRWDGTRFRVDRAAYLSDTGEDGYLGDIHIWADDAEVLVLDVSRDERDEYDRWRWHGVSAFRAGPWMAKLVDLSGRVIIADREWKQRYVRDFYGQRADRVDFG